MRVTLNSAFLLGFLISLTFDTLAVHGRPQQSNYLNNNRVGRLRFPSGGGPSSQNAFATYNAQSGVGGTGIPCNSPGRFVIAPDGCNRCYCELNSELSPACSRALCPPGFPSGGANANAPPLAVQPQA